MTLSEWADAKGYSDREVADLMTRAIQAKHPNAAPVSTAAVQKYRTAQVPGRVRMQAIHEITGGWVTANDFYGLDVAG